MSETQQASASGSAPRPLRVPVVFYRRFGAIREMAGQVREGVARVPDTAVDLLEVGDAPFPELQGGATDEEGRARRTALLDRVARADALVIGGPAYFGSLASPLKRFFKDLATASGATLDRTRPWHHDLFRDKLGAAFASSATPHGGNLANTSGDICWLFSWPSERRACSLLLSGPCTARYSASYGQRARWHDESDACHHRQSACAALR